MPVLWRRRIALAVVLLTLLVAAYSAIYQWALSTFEGIDTTYLDAVQVVVEAYTTAGFGGDAAHWTTPEMNLVVIVMNLTGVLLVFLAVPAFVVPLIREAIDEQLPTATTLEDHVIICSFTQRETVLADELEAAEVPYVIIEEDRETVAALIDDGHEAIQGHPETIETFRSANIGKAAWVVVDVSDDRNPTVILTVRDAREDVPIVSVAHTEEAVSHQRWAGADEVVFPRELLGRSLGHRAAEFVTRKFQEIDIGADFELSELVVEEGSPLVGQTIDEAGLRERFGVTVVGTWIDGDFIPVPEPHRRMTGNTILLVAGRHEGIQGVNVRSYSPGPRGTDDVVIVAGYGVVGRSVATCLEEHGVTYTVLDKEAMDAVDVVGDATTEATLTEVDVRDARAVILALDNDRTTINATLAIRSITQEVDVIARASQPENVKKLFLAGATYVLALTTVTGRLLADLLIEGETQIAPQTHFEIVQTEAPALVGESLEEADIRNRTGAAVIAVERNGEVITNPEASFRLEEGDEVLVAGSDEAVNEFITLAR